MPRPVEVEARVAAQGVSSLEVNVGHLAMLPKWVQWMTIEVLYCGTQTFSCETYDFLKLKGTKLVTQQRSAASYTVFNSRFFHIQWSSLPKSGALLQY